MSGIRIETSSDLLKRARQALAGGARPALVDLHGFNESVRVATASELRRLGYYVVHVSGDEEWSSDDGGSFKRKDYWSITSPEA